MRPVRVLVHLGAATAAAALLLVGVVVTPAAACSCLPRTEAEHYQVADAVFSAKVVAVAHVENDPGTVHDDERLYTARVRTAYKGDVPRKVLVGTSAHGSLCGLTLALGAEYLVFATGDAASGTVETTLCGGTRPAAQGPPSTGPGVPVTTPCAAPA